MDSQYGSQGAGKVCVCVCVRVCWGFQMTGSQTNKDRQRGNQCPGQKDKHLEIKCSPPLWRQSEPVGQTSFDIYSLATEQQVTHR